MKTSSWFKHYRKSTTVELNAPFYAWPTTATVKSWRKQPGRSRFVYTVKLSGVITHTSRFSRTAELEGFWDDCRFAGPGHGMLPVPAAAQFHRLPRKTVPHHQAIGPRHRNVVEFRHKSWWNTTVCAAFKEAGIVFCSCSGPRLPDKLIVTAPDVNIRFHAPRDGTDTIITR